MKRGILFLGLSMFIFITAYAQSLSLSWSGGAISNGQTITIIGDTAGTVFSEVDITNNGTDTLSVKVKKKELSLVSGSENSFCWLNCYLPNIYVSPYFINMIPDSLYIDFSGEYKAHGNVGASQVMYTFYDMNNVNDSVCVIVNYDCSMSSVPDLGKVNVEFSNAFPNPADAYTSFTYSFPASSTPNSRLIVRDLVGNIVAESNLTDQNGTIKIYTEKLNDGVYFYSLLLEDQVYLTRKLIVRH
jgi:hypothetical protein